MKIVSQDNNNFFLRFDKGEEIFTELVKFLDEHKIAAASFSAVGTCSTLELGYYNQFLKEYRKKPFMDNLEIVSLNGNAATLQDKPFVHAHGVFSRNDFTPIAGHVFKLVVAATCEMFLTALQSPLKRELNSDFNLNLLV